MNENYLRPAPETYVRYRQSCSETLNRSSATISSSQLYCSMAMDTATRVQSPLTSHEKYIDSLLRPSLSESRRISEIQLRKEEEIDGKYRKPISEDAAATAIQKAYRGHRARRQLEGLTLDPSSRWMEVIRELRYRAATLPNGPLERPKLSPDGRPSSSSDIAKTKWRRVGYIAEHASAGERGGTSTEASSTGQSASAGDQGVSMLMDVRYFLEMVDQKHRYGSNLQVFHEEWLRSQSDRSFFHWLDHGDGRHLDLPGCSREKLDRERIRYLSKDERRDYLVEVDEAGKLRWAKNGEPITTSTSDFKDSMAGIVRRDDESAVGFANEEVRKQASADRHLLDVVTSSPDTAPLELVPSEPKDDSNSDSFDSLTLAKAAQDGKPKKHRKRIIASPATILNKLLRATVRPGTWIYVADTVGRLYVGIKDSGAFQHASFLSGGRISSAGLIGIERGQLTYLSPLSGHYRPTTKSLRCFIGSLKAQGVDLSHMRVSHAYEVLLGIEYYSKTKQQLKKVHRQKEPKVDSSAPDRKLHDAINMSATDLVEENWKRGRRSTLTKLMDDLRIKRGRGEHG